MKNGKHLDLGCGSRPRNPYGYNKLVGVDIHKHPELAAEVEFKLANLAIEPIPFEDSQFDSISAFDFIEHIPRLLTGGERGTRFPFIELMNEIWRTLRPGGLFYALTPAYPRQEAFKDPTHVNIITNQTHEYFCEDTLYAEQYGFIGKFKIVEVRWVHLRLAYTADQSFKVMCKSLFRTLVRRKKKTHFLWQLRAIK